MKDVETLINKDIEQGNYHLILEGFTYEDWLTIDEEKKAILVVVIMDLLYLFIIIILFKLWL